MNTYSKRHEILFTYQEIEYIAHCIVVYQSSIWTTDADGNRPEERIEIKDMIILNVLNAYTDDVIEPNEEMIQIITESIYE